MFILPVDHSIERAHGLCWTQPANLKTPRDSSWGRARPVQRGCHSVLDTNMAAALYPRAEVLLTRHAVTTNGVQLPRTKISSYQDAGGFDVFYHVHQPRGGGAWWIIHGRLIGCRLFLLLLVRGTL